MALLMSAALLTYGVGELFSDGLHDCAARTIHDACRAGTSLGLMMVCVWFRYRGATPVDKARMRWMVAAVGLAVAAILRLPLER